MISGKKTLISDTHFTEIISSLRFLADEDRRDDWLIGLQLDYNYPVKIVSVKNPSYKRIIRLINISIEHGIGVKRDRLFVNGVLMLYYLLEKFAPQETIGIVKQLFAKKNILITINELESLFLLFAIGLFLSIVLFIIEYCYFLAFKYNKTLKRRPSTRPKKAMVEMRLYRLPWYTGKF